MAKYGRLANGEGTVSRLSGKRRKPFIVQSPMIFNKAEKQYKRVILGYATTYSEGMKMLYDFNSKRVDITKIHMTLNDFLIKFLEYKKNKLSNDTFRRYRNAINEHLENIKHTAIVNIKYDDLQNILNNVPSKTAATNIKLILTWCFDEAIKREIVQTNIASKLENNLEVVKYKPKIVFKNDEINTLWEEYNNNKNIYSAAYLLMLYSGCRVNEILKLKKDNIHLKENCFITGSKTTAGKNRSIPIHSKIRPIFEYLLSKKTVYLIETVNNKRYTTSNFSKAFRDSLPKLSHKTTHECRHTFISELQKLGVQLSKIKTIVGHSKKDVTDGVYTHYDIETLKEVVEQIKY